MAAPLLETKFFRPPLRFDWVKRPRLITRLNKVLQLGCRLALVSAPAGFGKTTLISSWADISECPVTWLSLDEKDNEPVRFWSYFSAAMNILSSGAGDNALASLQSQSQPLDSFLNDIVNGLTRLSFSAVFVLDDYHFINDSGIHEGLTYLIQHLPPGIHFVIATRSDPPWPLARLRGNGQIVELRTKDLRFTLCEVETFLRDVMNLPLSQAAVATLGRRTEGWIASLQLAALSLRDCEDADAFVDSFSASHRFVVDYLVEEVLGRQSSDVVSFLQQTSILDQMNASLCDAVRGKCDSVQLLTQIHEMNLFVIPLDEARHWYRYHHLFAGVLRNRLQQTNVSEISGLHQRACAWYVHAGLIPEALHHALAGENFEQAANVVEGNIMAMLDHGELKTLTAWLDMFPDDVSQTRPWLCLARAWVLVYTGELDKASAFLGCAERIQTEYEALRRLDEARHIAGHIFTLRAYQTAYHRDYLGSADLCSMALTMLPVTDATTRCFTALLRSSMLRRMGELNAAAEVLDAALKNHSLPPDSHTAVLARANLGILWRIQGSLHKAAAVFRNILSENTMSSIQFQYNLPLAGLGLAYVGLAEVHREWNDLATAEHLMREGVERGERWGNVDMLSGAYMQLARIMQASRNEEGMHTAIENLLELTQAKLPSMVPAAQADRAAILLSFGNVTAAITWAERSELRYDDEITFKDTRLYFVLARVLLIQCRLEQVKTLLEHLYKVVDRVGAVSHLIQILALEALLNHARGDSNRAFALLERAFSLAEPEGFIRVFLDLGPQLMALLKEALTAGISPSYVEVLLSAETTHPPEPADAAAPVKAIPTGQMKLLEPLSDRELEVLRLLRSSMTNGEIANYLHVSVNTVRTHIQHIYAKLGIHRRFDAVEHAQKLGLLPH